MNVLNTLHITYDLRDRLNREKTTAVKNLIDISNTFGNSTVIDLVRVPLINQEYIEFGKKNHFKINTFGLPYGILLKNSLNRVLKHINTLKSQNKINFNSINLIHAHKLTYEGYIGFSIAKEFNIPLVITLRQTDSRVLKNKPYYLSLYKEILHYSSKIFYLNPYSIIDLENRLGKSFFNQHIKNKLNILPNIINLNLNENISSSFTSKELLTIIRMTKESVKRKNLKRILIALSKINEVDIKLKIIGDGEHLSTVKQWVNKFKLNDRVIFLGSIPNSEIHKYYLESGGFILPSLSESFGMVYAEALICGTPILYSKNRLGFDGFFDGVGPAVDALSIDSIKQGIKNIISNNHFYRARISQLINENAFKIFSKSYIEQQYLTTLSQINNHDNI